MTGGEAGMEALGSRTFRLEEPVFFFSGVASGDFPWGPSPRETGEEGVEDFGVETCDLKVFSDDSMSVMWSSARSFI